MFFESCSKSHHIRGKIQSHSHGQKLHKYHSRISQMNSMWFVFVTDLTQQFLATNVVSCLLGKTENGSLANNFLCNGLVWFGLFWLCFWCTREHHFQILVKGFDVYDCSVCFLFMSLFSGEIVAFLFDIFINAAATWPLNSIFLI